MPVSPADLLDRMTILELRLEVVKDFHKGAEVMKELALVREAWDESVYSIRMPNEATRLWNELKATNRNGWLLEDKVRKYHPDNNGGMLPSEFAWAAAEAIKNNDRRMAIKRALNVELDSALNEEKHHDLG